MALKILTIREYPDPILSKTAEPVEEFDSALEELIGQMRISMEVADGVGLAAPQVGILKRLAVIRKDDEEYVLINPELLEKNGETTSDEGCLSFPGIFAQVTRPEKIRVSTRTPDGGSRVIEAAGFMARALLHEMDHLDGKLFIDYLSPMKRGMIRKKMKKREKDNN